MQPTTPRPYDRDAQCVKLIGDFDEIRDHSIEGHKFILEKLEKALSSESKRGKSGHWTYSVTRHQALVEAVRYERAIIRYFPQVAASEAIISDIRGKIARGNRLTSRACLNYAIDTHNQLLAIISSERFNDDDEVQEAA